jgi:hypothetical protein
VLDVGSRVKRAAAQAGLADEPFDWQMEDRRAWQWPVVWYDDPAASVLLTVVAMPCPEGILVFVGAFVPEPARPFYGKFRKFPSVTEFSEDWMALEMRILLNDLQARYGELP